MKKTIYQLIQEANKKKLEPAIQEFCNLNGITIGEGENSYTAEEVANLINESQENLYAQFTGRNFSGETVEDLAPISAREALSSSDVSIMFPRVISNVLQEPKEPTLYLTSIADKLNVPWDSPLRIEFPEIDALQASRIAEGQEYPVQSLGFQQHMMSLRIEKFGVMVAITEETLNMSIWPLIEMHMRLGANAVNRRIESILYQALTQRAQTIYDNTVNSTQTSGKAVSGGVQVNNGSLSYFDLVNMMGVLIGNRYTPTHFMAHPLAWPIFFNDPYIRAQFYNGGQLGQGVFSRIPSFDQSAAFPFGLVYVPYYALNYTQDYTFANTSTLSGMGQSLITDLYLLDKDNSLMLAERGGMDMDEKNNWYIDAKTIKIRKYAGISVKAGGRGIMKAANVRAVRNYEALFTVNNVSM